MKNMAHMFEKDPRTKRQREADLDNPRVTVTMYTVDDRDGTRQRCSVFKAEKTDWEPAVS